MRRLAILACYLVLCCGVACGSSGSGNDGGGKTPGKVHAPDGGKSQGDGSSSANDPDGGAGAGAQGQAGSAAGHAGNGQAGSGSGGHAGGGSSGGAGADGSGGATEMSKPLSQLREALAGAICDAIEACVGPSSLRELTQREDCATRVSAQLRATDFAYLDQAVSDGRVLYDPTQLPACMDGVRALECDVLSHSLPQACADVLVGNVALDGECVISADCVGTAFCAGGSQCPTHCKALLAAGDACSGDNQCGDDLMCVAGHCLRPSREGEPCNATSGKLCHLGFTCQGSTDVDPGTCVKNSTVQVGDEGGACEPGGALCKEGLSCVYDGSSAFHCEAAVASGGDCHLGLPGQCPNDEYCDATEVTQQSVCRKLPGDGEACVLSGLCAPGLVCVSDAQEMTCRAIADNCGACANDDACRSAHCAQGTCAPPPACGQALPCQ